MAEFKKDWRGLQSIGRAMSMIERAGIVTAEVRYYMLSTPPKVKAFATLRLLFADIGASKTACIGCWMSCSRKMLVLREVNDLAW